jgi:hypothetical protein
MNELYNSLYLAFRDLMTCLSFAGREQGPSWHEVDSWNCDLDNCDKLQAA